MRDWDIDGLCRLLRAAQAELRWHVRGESTRHPEAFEHQQTAHSLIHQIDHAVERHARVRGRPACEPH